MLFVFSCSVWDRFLSRKRAQLFCDNVGLVEPIRKGASKDNIMMHFLRCLGFCFFTAHYDIHITVSHLPGVQNTAADLLSRNKLQQFLVSQPTATCLPTANSTFPCSNSVTNTARLDVASVPPTLQVIQMPQLPLLLVITALRHTEYTTFFQTEPMSLAHLVSMYYSISIYIAVYVTMMYVQITCVWACMSLLIIFMGYMSCTLHM